MSGTNFVELFEDSDCLTAAFLISSRLSGGVFEEDLAGALQSFYLLPCPETAAVLGVMRRDIARLIRLSDGSERAIRKEYRGPALEGLDEFLLEAEARLGIAESIRRFISNEAGVKRVSAKTLLDETAGLRAVAWRYSLAGLKRPRFRDLSAWLKPKLLSDRSIWFLYADMIAVLGTIGRTKVGWNALGQREPPDAHHPVEIQVDIGSNADLFRSRFGG